MMKEKETLLKEIISKSGNSSLIKKAFYFAQEAHEGQKRISGEDYIYHPLHVAKTLAEMKLDSKTIAAGLLHDVVDDTEKTLEDIEENFGKEIAFLVNGVSKLGKLRYPKEGWEIKPLKERKESSIDFKAENLRRMFFAMAEDIRVVLIKLADRLHNMETLSVLPEKKQKRIALETLEIFAPLANRLGMGEIKGKLEDLAFFYLYPKEYKWLIENVKERYEERKKYLEEVKPFLINILKKEKIKPLDVQARPKNYWSLYQKLLKHEMNFERIYDLIALRVILKDVKSCYQALGIIHKYWRPLAGRIKDYIAFPKPNGYQALHTTVICAEGKIVEIQLKTKKMHEEAEYGIAAHWAFKEGVDLRVHHKKFKWVFQLKDWRRKILKLKKEREEKKERNLKIDWVKELQEWQKEVSESEEFLNGLKIDFFKNRIFVLTPKGDVIDLPEGATPVDFAYHIHTEIGHHCKGAKVNGKIVPLSQPLHNGEIVEILVDKNKTPSRDWLEFVKTNLAKSRIKSWFKQNQPPQKKELKKEEEKEEAPQKEKKKESEPAVSSIYSLKTEKEGLKNILIEGEEGIQAYFAKCCSPKMGDPVKGYITKTKGVSVHKINCPNFLELQKNLPSRIVNVTWKKEKRKEKIKKIFKIFKRK